MALDDSLHKKMVKVVLWKMAGLENVPELELQDSILENIKETAKPKIRWIKEFFLLGMKELKKDLKKSKHKNEK